MIVVDTSALMALLLDEEDADAIAATLAAAESLTISAGTVAEALIVAERRGIGAEMARLIEGLGFDVEPVALSEARDVAAAYRLWGKGVHPAGLNFGDCFAYALARSRGWPLLYVGEDFARTDLNSAGEPRA
ncbi:MAG: type II toxin-antitoxin system VapC family toxin [Rhodobacteraceae bacterium]|nr:type II toxin-antitoxin system VapC family toxin [Paracoccaceae bacterium]